MLGFTIANDQSEWQTQACHVKLNALFCYFVRYVVCFHICLTYNLCLCNTHARVLPTVHTREC